MALFQGKGHIFERDADGNWTLALQTEGHVDVHYSGFTEDWDEEWKWMNSLSREDENYVIVENDSGFSVQGPFPDYVYSNGEVSSMSGDYYPTKNNHGFDVLLSRLWNGTPYTSTSYNTSGYKSVFIELDSLDDYDYTYYSRADGLVFTSISHPSLDGARHALFAYIG